MLIIDVLGSFLFSKQNSLLKKMKVELRWIQCIVITRYWVRDNIGIAIRINDTNSRDTNFSRIDNSL